MSARYILGHCSACRNQAKKAPISGRWWHLGPACPQTSMFVFLPVRQYRDGSFGATDATEQPARFVADAL
jgi:hypothetical protein